MSSNGVSEVILTHEIGSLTVGNSSHYFTQSAHRSLIGLIRTILYSNFVQCIVHTRSMNLCIFIDKVTMTLR